MKSSSNESSKNNLNNFGSSQEDQSNNTIKNLLRAIKIEDAAEGFERREKNEEIFKSDIRDAVRASNELTVGVSTRVPFSEENRFSLKFTNRTYDYESQVYNIGTEKKYRRPSNVPPLDLTPIIKKQENKVFTTSYTETDSSSVLKNKLMVKSKKLKMKQKDYSKSDSNSESLSVSESNSNSFTHMISAKNKKSRSIVKDLESGANTSGKRFCGVFESCAKRKGRVALFLILVTLLSFLWNFFTIFLCSYVYKFLEEDVRMWNEPIRSGSIFLGLYLLSLLMIPSARLARVMIASVMNSFIHSFCLVLSSAVICLLTIYLIQYQFLFFQVLQRYVLDSFGAEPFWECISLNKTEEAKKMERSNSKSSLDSSSMEDSYSDGSLSKRKTRKQGDVKRDKTSLTTSKSSNFTTQMIIIFFVNWPVGLKVSLLVIADPRRKLSSMIFILTSSLILSGLACLSGAEVNKTPALITNPEDYYLNSTWGRADLFINIISVLFTLPMICRFMSTSSIQLTKKEKIDLERKLRGRRNQVAPHPKTSAVQLNDQSMMSNLNADYEEEVRREQRGRFDKLAGNSRTKNNQPDFDEVKVNHIVSDHDEGSKSKSRGKKGSLNDSYNSEGSSDLRVEVRKKNKNLVSKSMNNSVGSSSSKYQVNKNLVINEENELCQIFE